MAVRRLSPMLRERFVQRQAPNYHSSDAPSERAPCCYIEVSADVRLCQIPHTRAGQPLLGLESGARPACPLRSANERQDPNNYKNPVSHYWAHSSTQHHSQVVYMTITLVSPPTRKPPPFNLSVALSWSSGSTRWGCVESIGGRRWRGWIGLLTDCPI